MRVYDWLRSLGINANDPTFEVIVRAALRKSTIEDYSIVDPALEELREQAEGCGGLSCDQITGLYAIVKASIINSRIKDAQDALQWENDFAFNGSEK